MGEGGSVRLRAANEGNRAPDVAQRPQGEREVKHCRDAGVLSEAVRQIVIAARLEQFKRAFQMIARFKILSGEPMCESDRAVSDTGVGRIGSIRDVAEECRCVRSCRIQFAPYETASPEAIIYLGSFGRVLVAVCRLASSCEGFGCLPRPITAGLK
jgi:hypothetical protein